jgi:hypothetical protein
MPIIEYRIENRVAVVTLNDGENRFNPTFLQAFLDALMNETMEFATGLNKRREVVAEMKRRMHGQIARVIDQEDPPVIESGTFSV